MFAGLAQRAADMWSSAVIRLATPPDQDAPRPPQRDTVSGPGHDPDRVLLAGGGSAVGWGVLDHHLALAGYVARQVAGITGRGVDLDVNVNPVGSIPLLLSSLSSGTLARYDALVLTVGTHEAHQFMSVATWRSQLTALLDRIAGASNAPSVVVVGAEEGRPGAGIIERRAHARAAQLNAATRELVRLRPRVAFVASGIVSRDPAAVVDSPHADLYDRAARAIAPTLSAMLDLVPRSAETSLDDPERLETIERLRNRSLESDLELLRLVGTVRHLLDAADAVLVLVGPDLVEPIVSDRAANGPRPRAGSLSGIAIHHRGGLVIPDLAQHEEFHSRPDVSGAPHLRSYAGHPVPVAGHSVAVLAIVDTRVREFTSSELALLRGFCLRAGELLASAVELAEAS